MDLDYTDDTALVEAVQALSFINGDDNGDTNDTSTNTTTTATATSSSTTVMNPIYIPTVSGNDTWELTWPIWHMLPIQERKSIAKQNGFKSIGEFEESVILSRALNEDSNASVNTSGGEATEVEAIQVPPVAYSSEQLYELENNPQNFGLPILAERNTLITNGHDTKINNDHNNDDNDCESESSTDDDDIPFFENNNNAYKDELQYTTNATKEQIENGGLILLLPHDLIIHSILPYLPIEQYVSCALTSPHWKHFTRTEEVYKQLCQRCYLHQSKRKTLHVHRFNHSYHNMLNNRFRVKTGCGFYVLKCTKIKKIQRDMWTEIPFGVTLESTYYRYMSFRENNGTLLYALTAKPPHEMIPIFRKMNEQGSSYDGSSGDLNISGVSVIVGRYELQKDRVTVNVTHPWHKVRLVLRVLMDGYMGAKGRFWSLELENHWGSKSGDFDEYWSRDLVEYKVPDEPIFRFLRD